MAEKRLLSFSTGELDPKLHDRVTLERFNKGLATGRNVVIGRTGTIKSRPTTKHLSVTKNETDRVKLIYDNNLNVLIEVNESADVRFYAYDPVEREFLASDDSTLVGGTLFPTSGDIPSLDDLNGVSWLRDLDYEIFQISDSLFAIMFVHPFIKGCDYITYRYNLIPSSVLSFFNYPTGPTSLAVTQSGTTPTGYKVEYAVTSVMSDGTESFLYLITSEYTSPVAANQWNEIFATLSDTPGDLFQFKGVNVYRRPYKGGAFGFMGFSSYVYNDGGDSNKVKGWFVDYGGDPDFTHQPPEDIYTLSRFGGLAYLKSIKFYQDRFVFGGIIFTRTNPTKSNNKLIASRISKILTNLGYFTRDFPYNSDSAVELNVGSSGNAQILKMIELDGLVVFTTTGVFYHKGALSYENLILNKVGEWIIDDSIPPLVVSGSVFFVEKTTGIIRQIRFLESSSSYLAINRTVYSDHLFRGRKIVSWSYQDGLYPLFIISFSDGTISMYTFDEEHQMSAWTRGEFKYPAEQLVSTSHSDTSFVLINNNGTRSIEVTRPENAYSTEIASNPEHGMLYPFMDSIVVKQYLENQDLDTGDNFKVVPVTPDEWDGNLTLTCGSSDIFSGSTGTPGNIFRFFSLDDGSSIDLEIVSKSNDNEVIVEPSNEFPSSQSEGFRLYSTFDVIDGLDHLEGESVSVVVDGGVVASPNNDQEDYPVLTVSNKKITLPDDMRGAIIIVGRPITADIKTLNISTIEQSPSIIESLIVNKLYMKVFNTKGLYLDGKFPEEFEDKVDGTSVIDMEDFDSTTVPEGSDILSNRYQKPETKRKEVIVQGHWDSNGQVAIRQVDPYHFEIISIICDAEYLRR